MRNDETRAKQKLTYQNTVFQSWLKASSPFAVIKNQYTLKATA
jgi:hypothetical protein